MARDDGLAKSFRLNADACPIPEAVEVLGERWTCLILRASTLGLRHFEEYQACLGIARNILSDRLARLVEAEIFARSPDPADGRRVIYALTPRGAALLPVLVALWQWAMDHGMGKPNHPMLADKRDRQPLRRITAQSHDGRELGLADLVWIDREGREARVR